MGPCRRKRAGILLALVCAGVVACGRGASEEETAQQKTPPAERTVPVVVGAAAARRVEERLQQVGTLQASREVTVRSQIAGIIVEIQFSEGEPVHQGDVLVRMDSAATETEIRTLEARIRQLDVRLENRKRDLERSIPLVQAEIRKLEERLRQLQARLENRQRDVQRNRPLVEKDLVSRQTFDRIQTEIQEIQAEIAESEVELARQKDLVANQTTDRIRTDIEEIKAEIAQTEAELAHEKVHLADHVIRAPFDAVAGVREVNVGDYLKEGAAVVAVVDLDPLEISFRVPEKYKAKIAKGKTARLAVDAFPGQAFQGEISFISPQVDSDTRTFQVKAQVRNPEGKLNPGMFARVDVVAEVHEDAVTLPWESVIQTETETYVYVLEDDTARKVPVELGRRTAEWAEVLHADIRPGARVVLEGKFALRDGTKVAVQGGESARPADKL